MLLTLIVFGIVFFASRWLARSTPAGWPWAVAVAGGMMILAPVIGFAAGAALAYTDPVPGVTLGSYLLAGMKDGLLASLTVPFIVWHSRRQRRRGALATALR